MSVVLLGILTQATQCEDEPEEPPYVMSDDNVPQDFFLTTISTAFFQENIVGYGWKWKESRRIDKEGRGVSYDASTLTDYIPDDLYFGTDSMTVFVYKQDCNERRTDSYVYDATDNRVLSHAIDYMQLTYATSYGISFIERHGDSYYHNYYEPMLPYELNARWNGSKPAKP